MWKSFVILFIVTTNLYTLLDSYKITDENSSKTIDTFHQEDSSTPREEYIEENYSNEDSYKELNGRVVIGKWRNNGEALEPKWRDGDSVPLAPFSTISFKSGWRKDPDSREEDYRQISESENLNENRKENFKVSLTDKNRDAVKEPEENRSGNRNSNFGTLILAAENYRHNEEGGQRVGQKNSQRTERQFNGSPNFHPEIENSSDRILQARLSRLPSTLREQLRNDDIKGNIQGYRETLDNYPKEYELFENENDDPRPRKRRPPEHNEFPGSFLDAHKREEIGQSESSIAGNDLRRYSMANLDQKSMNGSKSQENEELKTFLKMQGDNLSLSEILQQQNLTLADLLKGKLNAINILKSNEGKLESISDEETSMKKSALTETAENISANSTTGISRWSNRRRIMIRKLNKNSNIANGKNNSDFDLANFETTTQIVDTTTIKKAESGNNVSPFNNATKFINDDDRISPDEFEDSNVSHHVEKNKSVSHEFLKPLENRESLITEATTVVQYGTESALSDHHDTSVISNDKYVQPSSSNDDDEIMEFSDYPAAKMPKLVSPMIYEAGILNTKRKNIPFSAIRMRNNPVGDSGLKLNEENILSPSDKKLRTNINETDNVNEEFERIMENETQIIKLPENIEKKSKVIENQKQTVEKNEDEIISEDVKNDFIQSTKEPASTVGLVNETRSNEYETLQVQEEKNLTLNNKLHEVVIPKVDPQSRAEILELFSSGSSAERLERLLASRNMTIEELIALRQRGSSQVHLAEVFKAKQQTPTSASSRQILKRNNSQILRNYQEDQKNQVKETTEKINVEKENDDENLESAKTSTGNKKKDTFGTEAEYVATDLFKLFSDNKNLRKNFSTFDKTYLDSDTPVINPSLKSVSGIVFRKAIGNSDSEERLQDFSDGNNIHKDSEGSSYYTSIEAVKLPIEEADVKKMAEIFEREKKGDVMNSVISEEIGRVEEILNNDLKSLKTTYGINDYEYSEKKALSKVKPSIIASGGILGVTVVVFLSIFIACRIQQKKKFAYKNSFAKAVFRNPVMTARKLSNTSSINTIMVDVVATSTAKRPQKHGAYESDDFESKSEIDNDSLDANDSWDTIPDFMK